jgi:hypothetical protein
MCHSWSCTETPTSLAARSSTPGTNSTTNYVPRSRKESLIIIQKCTAHIRTVVHLSFRLRGRILERRITFAGVTRKWTGQIDLFNFRPDICSTPNCLPLSSSDPSGHGAFVTLDTFSDLGQIGWNDRIWSVKCNVLPNDENPPRATNMEETHALTHVSNK